MIFLDLMARARAGRGALLALTMVACASSEQPEGTSSAAPGDAKAEKDAGAKTPDAGRDADDAPKARDAGHMPIVPVSPEAAACAASLPFKPDGCDCDKAGETTSCWTGKPGDRNRGTCKDGVQKCVQQGDGEFYSLKWGSCEGEITDCGEPAAPEEECKCIPGATIACDEDCATLVICSLTGAKTCQPDGAWGPCREQLWTGNVNPEVLLGCRNFFHGCLPLASEGVYVGDCSKQFECGHVPGLPAAPTPPATPVQ